MSVSVFLWPVSASFTLKCVCVCVSFRKRFSFSFVAVFFLFLFLFSFSFSFIFFLFSFSWLTRGPYKNPNGYDDDENDSDDDNTISSSFFFFLNFVLIFFNVILPQIVGESSDAMAGIQSTFRKSLDNFLNFFTGFKYALATMPPPPPPLMLVLLLPLVLNILWSNLFGGFFDFDWIISVLDRTIACFDLLPPLRLPPLLIALMLYAVSGDSDVERFSAGNLYWIGNVWSHGMMRCDGGVQKRVHYIHG